MSDYANLGKSGIMRTIEDYAMGINFSRVMSVKYGRLLNDAAGTQSYTAIAVGRVMTCVLGMVVIREREIRNFAETPFYRVVGNFLPVQKAAIAALTGPLDMVKTQCGLYQQRRDALCGGLRSIGWNVPDSHGSMFVWAPIPAKYAKSMDFCLDLVEKSGVLCTPGSSFGPLGEGYVRFALTLPPERIAEAVQSIKASGILN